jgi:hypothetical protein
VNKRAEKPVSYKYQRATKRYIWLEGKFPRTKETGWKEREAKY